MLVNWLLTTFSTVERHGRLLFLALFVCLLAGRFSLGRLSGEGGDFDLRVLAALIVLFAYVLWFRLAASRTSRIPIGTYGTAFAGFCVWMAMSAAWAPDGARLTPRIADIGFLVLFVFLGLHIASRLPGTSALWWWIWVTGMVYFSAAVLAGPGDQGRYAALGGGPNVFVRVMILGSIAALALAVIYGVELPLLGLPLFTGGVVLSGSRGGLAAFAVVVAIGIVPVLGRLTSRVRRKLIVGAASVGILAFLASQSLMADLWQNRFVAQTLIERYDSSRISLFRSAWSLYAENPAVGAGIDGFHAENPRWQYSHNLFLGVAAEAGTVGLALIAAALTALGRITWVSRPLGAQALFSILAGISVLVASMFSGDLYDSRFMWFFFGLAVIEMQRSQEGTGSAV